jgi:hypothetical protein
MTINTVWRFFLKINMLGLPYILGMLLLMRKKKRNVTEINVLWVTVTKKFYFC